MERWVFRSFWKVGLFNLIYSSYDMETFESSSYKSPEKIFLGYFRLPEGYTYLRTLIANIFLWSIEESTNFTRLAVNEIWKTMQFWHYEGGCLKGAAWTVCRFKAGGFGKKEGMVLLRMEGWYPNAHYEQPTLYDWRFTRYGKSCNFEIVRLPKTKKYILLGHFRLSERYIYISEHR